MTTLYVQSPTLYLAGAGVVIGATSVTLTSLTDIYGNVLTMSDFGAKGFITLEPDTSNAEAATFTGVTANGNGTYTLTGIKTILAKSPYTETSGLVRNHAGGTKVVVTDNVAFWNTFGNKENVNTWSATQTFTIPPLSATQPTASDELANKAYVDQVAIQGAPVSATTVLGIAKISVNPASAVNPIAVGDNDPRVPTQLENDALVGDLGVPSSTNLFTTQQGFIANSEKYAADAGGTDSYAITLSPAPTAYVTGMVVYFKANTANTGAATLNVNSLGAKTIVKGVSTTLADGDIGAGQFCTVIYDGTNFVLQNPTLAPKSSNGTRTLSSTATTTITLGYRPKKVTLHSIHGPSASIIGGTIPAHSNGGYDATTGTMWCTYSTWNQTGTAAAGGSSTSLALVISYGNNPTSSTVQISNITDTGFDVNEILGTAAPVYFWTAIG